MILRDRDKDKISDQNNDLILSFLYRRREFSINATWMDVEKDISISAH
jgi:hypothetical protein